MPNFSIYFPQIDMSWFYLSILSLARTLPLMTFSTAHSELCLRVCCLFATDENLAPTELCIRARRTDGAAIHGTNTNLNWIIIMLHPKQFSNSKKPKSNFIIHCYYNYMAERSIATTSFPKAQCFCCVCVCLTNVGLYAYNTNSERTQRRYRLSNSFIERTNRKKNCSLCVLHVKASP